MPERAPSASREPAASAPVATRPCASRPERPILAAGTFFHGILVLPGPARIEGRVRGEILAGGPVWVGESGLVEADLEADVVVVEGRVDGDLRARSRIELGPRAIVRGDIHAPRLVISEGSLVNGRCCCGDGAPASANVPERSPKPVDATAPAP